MVFLGSVNWDPRSAYLNIAPGVTIDSPENPGVAADELDTALPHETYQLILDEDGQLTWISQKSGSRAYSPPSPK